jgi:hypothetical protein
VIERTNTLLMRSALYSDDMRYRYVLRINWNDLQKPLMVIGLNPSTATENQDDPTVAKCVRIAKRWDCGSLIMTNLFAYRATEPADMKKADDPIGPDNTVANLRGWARQAKIVVAAWGNHGTYRGRGEDVVDCMKMAGIKLDCLRMSKDGNPWHPLYLPEKDLTPIPFNY